MNKREGEEFDTNKKNKLKHRKLFKIVKIPQNNKKINKTYFPLILINANNKNEHYPLESNYI